MTVANQYMKRAKQKLLGPEATSRLRRLRGEVKLADVSLNVQTPCPPRGTWSHTPNAWVFAWLVAFGPLLFNSARGDLVIKLGEPKTYGQKTIVKMELQNTFTNKIGS